MPRYVAEVVVLHIHAWHSGFDSDVSFLRRVSRPFSEKKLAPTVKNRQAEAGTLSNADAALGGGGGGGIADGLGLTMFDRVLRDLGHQVCRMLDVQYRMNRDICDWASIEVRSGLGWRAAYSLGSLHG